MKITYVRFCQERLMPLHTSCRVGHLCSNCLTPVASVHDPKPHNCFSSHVIHKPYSRASTGHATVDRLTHFSRGRVCRFWVLQITRIGHLLQQFAAVIRRPLLPAKCLRRQHWHGCAPSFMWESRRLSTSPSSLWQLTSVLI
jgi:hypothetical protein